MPPTRAAARVVRRVGALALAVAACTTGSADVAFEPAVGDTFRFEAEVDTLVDRRIGGQASGQDQAFDSVSLVATETVTAIDDEAITATVEVARDGIAVDDYEVRFDRADRLLTLDVVGGAPAAAIGLGPAIPTLDVDANLTTPPGRDLRPGDRWDIHDDAGARIGGGRVESLGIVDGRSVAVVVVELTVHVDETVPGPDGEVALRGRQTSRSRTAYDLDDGIAATDETVVRGSFDLRYLPPTGVTAEPVTGRIAYEIRADTRRVPG